MVSSLDPIATRHDDDEAPSDAALSVPLWNNYGPGPHCRNPLPDLTSAPPLPNLPTTTGTSGPTPRWRRRSVSFLSARWSPRARFCPRCRSCPTILSGARVAPRASTRTRGWTSPLSSGSAPSATPATTSRSTTRPSARPTYPPSCFPRTPPSSTSSRDPPPRRPRTSSWLTCASSRKNSGR